MSPGEGHDSTAQGDKVIAKGRNTKKNMHGYHNSRLENRPMVILSSQIVCLNLGNISAAILSENHCQILRYTLCV